MDSANVQQIISGNLARVKDQIAAAASVSGVAPESITLVCVTKYVDDAAVQALLAAGATDLGESLLPRGVERFTALRSGTARFRRHLIGPQQSRKIKMIPGNFDLVQAVDRLKIADMLSQENEQIGQRQDVLLQVNVAGEEQKHGVEPEMTMESTGYIMEQCPGIRLCGLMAVPPGPEAYRDRGEFERETRAHFTRMKGLFDTVCDTYPDESSWETLSLGMSQDYTWAIEEGATMVRVGSSLFAGLQ